MRYRWGGLPTALIPLFVAVAVLGYVAGHSSSKGGSAEKLHTATSANAVIDRPPGWRPVAGGPGIPRLAIVRPLVLAPDGDASHAALVVGRLPRGELSPLPGRFVSSLGQLPSTEIVNLVEIEAYRYGNVSVPGFKKTLTIFVVPNPGGEPTVLACYAASGFARYLNTCEETVAGVTLVGQSQNYELMPEPNYARKISATIATLDGLRVALTRELGAHATATTVQDLATRLGGAYARASTSVSALEPSFAAEPTQAALLTAIQRARDAYAALATAAAEESISGYQAARKRISEAESDVDWVLENYELLGYSSTTGVSKSAKS